MGTGRVRRRRFIEIAGAAAGAVAGGRGAAWASSPRIEPPERRSAGSSGSNATSKRLDKRLLIAYATKAGSTAEVADFVGKRLTDAGLTVDVQRADRVRSLDGYTGVIVGSAIRAGRWLSEASDFVKRHRDALASRQTAFFTLCMTLQQDTPENREKAAAYLKPVRQILEPSKIAFFAGRMDYSKLAFLPRMIVKRMKVPEGDFRNWDAIGAWADTVRDEMLVAPRA